MIFPLSHHFTLSHNITRIVGQILYPIVKWLYPVMSHNIPQYNHAGYLIILFRYPIWLVVWNMLFPYIGNFIIPTDEFHHFSEG